MATTDTTAPSNKQIMQAYDVTSLCVACMADLGALFSAIKHLSPEHSDIRHLANLGQFATENYGGIAEHDCGELKKLLPQ